MNMTKKAPHKATNSHISMIGHVTKGELQRNLTQTEAGNGFANRFLWMCVKRSKQLPDGGRLDDADLVDLVKRLKGLVRFAVLRDPLYKDPAASALWHRKYGPLSTGMPGLYGDVTARAEAYVMRLACVYALLDRQSRIKLPQPMRPLTISAVSSDLVVCVVDAPCVRI